MESQIVEFVIGATYELDGKHFRCQTKRDSNILTFQELNSDGSDYVEYFKNSDGEETQVRDYGERLIHYRLNELKLVQSNNS
jgi:hypothetical protein